MAQNDNITKIDNTRYEIRYFVMPDGLRVSESDFNAHREEYIEMYRDR